MGFVIEMVAVIAATGLAVAAPPLVLRRLGVHPLIAIPAAGLSACVLTRLVGELAILHYRDETAVLPFDLEERGLGSDPLEALRKALRA